MAEWFAGLKSDFITCFLTKNRWKYLATGLGNTLIITLMALLLGVVLGVIAAVVRSTYDKNREDMRPGLGRAVLSLFNFIAKIYLTVIRGTPVVVQLMIIYYVIFASSNNGVMIAALAFGIPAVKGVEFGAGFAFAAMRGSEANDPFAMRNGQVATATNKNGGINGGITNGMPLVFRTVLKPTPSIYKQQHTVDYIARQDADLQIKGRHDPCIVPRAAVVQNTLAAFGLLDLLTVRYGTLAQKHGLPQE